MGDRRKIFLELSQPNSFFSIFLKNLMLMSAYDILIMNNQSDKMKGIHMKKTKEQHNERKKEIMENASNAMQKMD